ncbi:flagellar motor switch phosphatase FliY [Planococcus sp. 4-30]|uniref:flagellar motor switch phosphatase FliY n=1 Tax=Planococcus sp. 4-30 TaxID=2874583 RepID=UPI001CBD0C92|nr:flagellar motor switch phosphatase FliY [Planococcus sp. 4-30]
MTTDKLSPDEVKGLLGQQTKSTKLKNQSSLSKSETEVLTELLTVSLGGSATVLSPILGEGVTVSAPILSVIERDHLLSDTVAPFFIVLGEYAGGIKGIQILSINKEEVSAAAELVDSSSNEDADKQFQVIQDFIQEMFNSVSSSLSKVLECEIVHSLSGMDTVERHEDFRVGNFTNEEWFVEAAFEIKISNLHKLNLHLCIPIRLAKQMVGILADSFEEEEEEAAEETQIMPYQTDKNSIESESITQKSHVTDQAASPQIQNVQFSSFDEPESTDSEPNNLNMLLDIPLQVTVELGRTKRMVKEILEISQGSIIELDKLAGEPVDILINNKLIAVGEVVVIDENFGVRVTDVLSTAERISKLR